MSKRWRIATYDSTLISQLAQSAAVPIVVAQLLVGRNIKTLDAARSFLDSKLTDLRDPDELPGIVQAARFLYDTAQAGKSIAIYGDYDADGMTGAAILLRCLRLLRANVRAYVPHRLNEGYGLNAKALDRLASDGVQVVVTVDNGIANVAEAEHARRLGLDLIVTDHHQFAPSLPVATAIVHPALPDGDYPFDGLCGAAVAFKLAWALCRHASDGKKVAPAMREFLLQATGLAAIGTLADVVPLIDENRAIVRHGLNALSSNPAPGIAALVRVAGLDRQPSLAGDDVAFALAPRLNAAGRLGQAELGVELLATDNPDRATELASFIDELNSERQSLERSVLLAARKQAKNHFDPVNDPALVLADRGWHAGVIGIVAGKLAEQYNRPVVLISQDKLGSRPGTGSGRSVAGFDLHRAFASCATHLTSHGGHAAAAGLRVEDSEVDAFRDAFCEVARAALSTRESLGTIDIDAEVPFAALTRQNIDHINTLAPFGCGNRRPLLCSTGVLVAAEPKLMGKTGRHLSVDLEQGGVRLRAVAFGGGDWLEDLKAAGGLISVAFQPVLNQFRGRTSVEIHIVDWRTDDRHKLRGYQT